MIFWILYFLVLLCISGAATEFYWDYFSLWGMHAKWVWATGDFGITGESLPSNLWYHGPVSRILGYVLNKLGLESYPDGLWSWFVGAAFVVLIIVFGWETHRRKLPHALPRTLLLLLALALIHPSLFKIEFFGGCVEILVGLSLGFFLEALWSDKIGAATLWGVICILIKPITLPWLLLGWPALRLKAFVQAERGRWRLARWIPWLALLLVYIWARPQTPQGPAIRPDEFQNFHFSDLLQSVFYVRAFQAAGLVFVRNNFFPLVVLLGAWALLRSRAERAAILLYAGLGTGFIAAIYLSVLKGEAEFYSLERYALVMAVALATAVLLTPEIRMDSLFTQKVPRTLFWILLVLVAGARTAEELPRFLTFVQRGGLDVCAQVGESACLAAQRVRDEAQQHPECEAFVVSEAVFASYGMDAALSGYWQKYGAVYEALPTRSYFEVSKIPAGLKACPIR